MEASVKATIESLATWEEYRQFEANAAALGRLTPEVQAALKRRSVELGKRLVADQTGLALSQLTPAEERIVEAAGEYAAIKSLQRSHASRTFGQIKRHGLIGAAEASVCKTKPTAGFQVLTEADHMDLSYEQIVVDYPNEFSARALWYSRKTLGLVNDQSHPPAAKRDVVQTATTSLIEWLQREANEHDGTIPIFTNLDAALVMGFQDMQTHGQVHGNIQSRVDFACYQLNFPPLGLAAKEPFSKAWGQDKRDWVFPVVSMQEAAQSRRWTNEDFVAVLRKTEEFPGQAHLLWKDALTSEEERVKAWAYSFGNEPKAKQAKPKDETAGRNERWGRDELILALDLYMAHQTSPLPKGSPEIAELSQVLNDLGKIIGNRSSVTFRNEAGVYMKLMNFRSRDPQYTVDGKVGLRAGNKDEAVVWQEFASDPARLARAAAFIREGIRSYAGESDLSGQDEPDIAEAEEGKLATRVHRYRERDRRLVELAKSAALSKYGRLKCVACDFDFSSRYGEIGSGVIDVHHTIPVHTMKPGDKTKVSDLALLCSNCHRIVHSKRKWLSVEDVKAMLR